jgi:cytochrome b6-f complex iron-sulfur subunit
MPAPVCPVRRGLFHVLAYQTIIDRFSLLRYTVSNVAQAKGNAMNRRGLLKSLLGILSTTLLVSFVYPLIRFLAPPKEEAEGKKIIIKKSEIPAGSAKDIVVNGIPSIVINTPDKGFIALSKVCTHLGCLVQYDKIKGRLICPCHAGVYTLEGKVVSGPPPKPLQKFPVKGSGEDIIIG